MIEGADYFVRRVEFPNLANRACVVPNNDGTFDIYINALYPPSAQAEALEHELRHLARDHFYTARSVPALEAEANGERVPSLRPPRPGMIACFASLQALADYVSALIAEGGLPL